jgi:hypothetical protein
MAEYLEPQTDGELRITVTQAGALRDDATVTADIYTPKGVQIATAESFAAQGSGSGAYILQWDRTWSETNAGKPIEGEFLAVVTVVRGSMQRVRHFRVPIRFDDDS